MSTGYSRVKAAIKGETEEVAAYPIIGAITTKYVGKTVKEYLTDTEVIISGQLAAYEDLKQDAITVEADMLIEAEAMGSQLAFPEDNICHAISYPLKTNKGKIDKLQIPDPHKDGRIPYILEACKQLKKAITNAPVGGVLVGPWSIAISLRDMKELIFDTFDDPQYVHDLMKITTETARVCGDAMLETGVSLSFTDAAASCDIISPGIYKEFIKPYHIELFKHFKNRKAGVTLHICGNTRPILRDMVETGATALSIDSKVPLSKAVEIIGKDTVIIGNVETNLFVQRDNANLKDAIKKCLDEALKRSRYILCTGCEVPINASLDSIRLFMKIARELGGKA